MTTERSKTMDNDNNWGQDAPQNQNRWNERESHPEPIPHYDHYQMHRNLSLIHI